MATGPNGADSRTTDRDQFRARFLTMRIVHMALVAGVVMFGVVALFVVHGRMSSAPSLRNPLCLVAAVLCAATLLASSLIRPPRAKTISPVDAGAALGKYQAFCLTRAALIEGGALFSAVAMIVTGNVMPAVLLAVSTAALVLRRPSEDEFSSLFPSARS